MEKKYLLKSPEISQNLNVSVFYLVEMKDHMILGCDFARFGLNNMANGTKLSSHLLRQQFGIKPFGFLVKLLSPIVSYYRQQGKAMFSEASVILPPPPGLLCYIFGCSACVPTENPLSVFSLQSKLWQN